MWQVKICGNRTATEIAGAIASGADAIGLIVGARHFTEDELSPDRAQALLKEVAAPVVSVLVTHLTDTAEVLELHTQVPTSAIQLHDDIARDDVQRIRRARPGVRLIKAVHVTGPEAIVAARSICGDVDALLLDSRTENRIGGTGHVHDWRISAEIVRAVGVPVILAGGLNPDNVAAAIGTVRPHGVDVNSGVEHADGRKDRRKVALFIQRSKQALSQVGEIDAADLGHRVAAAI